MTSLKIRKLTYSAMLLALAVLMPRVAGLIPEIGKTLNLMHIPVLLCGFLCGWPWGLAVGFAAPLFSSLLNAMPKIFPDAVVMAFELATYGAAAGIIYRLLTRKKTGIARIYIALLAAMAAGRIMYGIVYLCLLQLGMVDPQTIADAIQKLGWDPDTTVNPLLVFVWGKTIVTPIYGIILQAAVVPMLTATLERAGLSLNKGRKTA